MKIGIAIKISRTKKSIKQKDLAQAIGISQTYLSLVENDKRDPSFGLVHRIAQHIDIPMAFLIFIAEEQDSQKSDPIRTAISESLWNLIYSSNNDQ